MRGLEVFINVVLGVTTGLITVFILGLSNIFKNRAVLMQKFGFKRTQFDIPYDFETDMVMLVETEPYNSTPAVIALLQTSKTLHGWENASKVNADDLALTKNLYVPKNMLVM